MRDRLHAWRSWPIPRTRMNASSSQLRAEPDPRRYVQLAPTLPEGPISLQTLWPDRAEWELEIGFGRGMFLLERARAATTAGILGLEIKRKWAYLVGERAQRLGLTNVRAYAADAREVLPRLTPEASLARVFMHFPDPWWKKRHAKRRLRGPDTFAPVSRILKPSGELFIQTDVEERAEMFLQDLRALGEFRSAEYVQENPYCARSNREKRAIEDGLPVFRILAVRG
jgi:tRNA (guanine-N7-)-methyltransferase